MSRVGMAVALLALWAAGCSSKGGHSVDGSSSDTMPIGTDGSPDRPEVSDGGCGSGGATKDNGLACGCAAECKSNFCIEGVCCNSACGGTCMTCALPTSLGTCSMVPAGVKPRDLAQCKIESPTTCGRDGTCNGAGVCRRHPPGTVCKAGTCNGAAIVGMDVCDPSGACRPGPSTVCVPFLCSTATNQCLSTCSKDADCTAGKPCLGGSCGPKERGKTCEADAECESGHCTDGVCCDAKCDGVCQSCNQMGTVGTCTPTPVGQGHALCVKLAPSTCGTTGVCDGEGTCTRYPANTPCAEAVCVDATSGNSAQTCDGLGTCLVAKTFTCGNFACSNGACTESCTSRADCAPGRSCTIVPGQTVGTCGKKVDGQSCSADADCENAHCADGVCCATTCNGACRSCAVAGLLGTCTFVAAGGADPHSVCKDLRPEMCSTNGRCDGAGICQKYVAGTVCAAQTCTGSSFTPRSTCSVDGRCVQPPAITCSPFQCNVDACFTACTTDIQCLSPNTCGMGGVANSCGKKAPGQPCSNATQCASGQCAQGVCCNTACNTACQACNIQGSLGICVGVTAGSDPQGMCIAQAQSTCGRTGQCQQGQCANWPAGAQCRAPFCGGGTPPTTITPAATCNGAGNCVTPPMASCPAICSNNACGFQSQGGACIATSQCASGLTCVDGVCCNNACNAACAACNLAGRVGTCSPRPSGTVCRGSAGACDPAETCNGTMLICPGDALAPATTVCRAAAGVCDVPEMCTGSSPACPANGFSAATTVCRASAGACDVVERCTGSAAACPADGFSTATTVCRASAGACDVVERCTGTAAACPADGFSAATTVCRASAGVCDVLERCTGSAAACPGDVFVPSTMVCRASAGVCDVAERCTGSAAACPGDGFLPPSMVCRGSAGVCDVAESCTGSSAVCPVEAFLPASTVCRGSAGVCDVAESCTGSSAACPAEAFLPASTVCRGSAGACDVAESCTGSSAACPVEAFLPASTVCRGSAGACDVAESCTGSAAACPADGFASPSVVCSPASCSADGTVLTSAGTCSGSGATCPTPATTMCPTAVCDAAMSTCS